MGKISQHGKWWLALVDDLKKLQKTAMQELQEAKNRDTGRSDEALRQHWYWHGYTQALDDIEHTRIIPTAPSNLK